MVIAWAKKYCDDEHVENVLRALAAAPSRSPRVFNALGALAASPPRSPRVFNAPGASTLNAPRSNHTQCPSEHPHSMPLEHPHSMPLEHPHPMPLRPTMSETIALQECIQDVLGLAKLRILGEHVKKRWGKSVLKKEGGQNPGGVHKAMQLWRQEVRAPIHARLRVHASRRMHAIQSMHASRCMHTSRSMHASR
eukprot:356200-Chlamydomonas_euryale.AAC.2